MVDWEGRKSLASWARFKKPEFDPRTQGEGTIDPDGVVFAEPVEKEKDPSLMKTSKIVADADWDACTLLVSGLADVDNAAQLLAKYFKAFLALREPPSRVGDDFRVVFTERDETVIARNCAPNGVKIQNKIGKLSLVKETMQV